MFWFRKMLSNRIARIYTYIHGHSMLMDFSYAVWYKVLSDLIYWHPTSTKDLPWAIYITKSGDELVGGICPRDQGETTHEEIGSFIWGNAKFSKWFKVQQSEDTRIRAFHSVICSQSLSSLPLLTSLSFTYPGRMMNDGWLPSDCYS